MPAIQLGRLKIQSAQLAERFNDPAAFCRGFHELLDFYADRAYRPGQAGEPPPLLRSYNVPQPILRQVLKDLIPQAVNDPPAGFGLCDALWQVAYLEFRWMAAALLGQLPPDPPAPILERIEAWATPSTESRLVDALLSFGLARLRAEKPERTQAEIQAWLISTDQFTQQLGLQALPYLLDEPGYDNLPQVYPMITQLVRAAPSTLRPDLLNVLKKLATISPRETAYFLRQNLTIRQDNPGTAWLARNSLASFPPEIQSNLRAAIREAK
jgi:hypothetical protein